MDFANANIPSATTKGSTDPTTTTFVTTASFGLKISTSAKDC